MLDRNELRKYFTDEQQNDVLKLSQACMNAAPSRPRRPRVRKVRPGHIPRPVNSFMTFRAEKQSLIRMFCPLANHRDISKIVALWWHKMSPEEKSKYVLKAAEAKKEHSQKYPNYVFKPKTKKQTKRMTNTKKIHFKESPFLCDSEQNQQVMLKEESGEENVTYHQTNLIDPLVMTNLEWMNAGDYSNIYNHDFSANMGALSNLEIFPDDAEGSYPFLTPATQFLETPSQDYLPSPMVPGVGFEPYNNFCQYNTSTNDLMVMPVLDDTSALGYPYDIYQLRY